MSKQLVNIVNRVNNAAIRRIKNERGELIYVVPSFTLPDNCVMNGGLYPAEEIERGFMTLEDTPAPAGHPYDSQGNYIIANSPDGILYFQCGIFNKNVQRVQDDKYGHRIYVEKHIHVETAMKSERGKRIIDAIDRGQPIHTSTGVLLNRKPQSGIMNGKQYEWVANGIVFDHDAILLDEEGAATPNDGVGMLVNKHLIKQVERQGAQLAVNTASLNINQSFNDLREILQAEVQQAYGEDERHVWIADFGDDYAVFEKGETPYKVSYTKTDSGIKLSGEAQEVRRVTTWETVTNAIKGLFNRGNNATQHNQEGEDMFKEHIESVLKANKVDYSAMSDEHKIAEYDKIRGNAAEQPKPAGEQEPAQGEKVVNADVQKLVDDAVAKAMEANQKAQESAERTQLAEQLKANKVDLSDEDQKSMSVNALKTLVDKTTVKNSAMGVPGGSPVTFNSESRFGDDLPE